MVTAGRRCLNILYVPECSSVMHCTTILAVKAEAVMLVSHANRQLPTEHTNDTNGMYGVRYTAITHMPKRYFGQFVTIK